MAGGEDFERLTNPYRRELLAHCYRMLGSVHDAEDLLQETFLRAWRSYGTFDGKRASLRTWLYRIATNACLTALEQRSRRPLPSWFEDPSDTPEGPLDRRSEAPWLEPFPDVLLDSATADPASVVALRSSIRLAFIASLQHLPAKQRGVLPTRRRWHSPRALRACAHHHWVGHGPHHRLPASLPVHGVRPAADAARARGNGGMLIKPREDCGKELRPRCLAGTSRNRHHEAILYG
jgi:RNA polymerase sigma factor (sigma-70 family)